MLNNPSRIIALRYLTHIGTTPIDDPHFDDERLSHDNLMWMCEQIAINGDTWPEDKTGRWLGFVQGVLAAQGVIDVDQEREATRGLFHDYYESMGITAPKTMERV